MQVPYFQSTIPDLVLLQTKWRSILNSFLGNPSLNSLILEKVALQSGSNVINHLLGRKLQGWRIVRIRASATIYDTQDSNNQPDLTLFLTSSANAVADIEVF